MNPVPLVPLMHKMFKGAEERASLRKMPQNRKRTNWCKGMEIIIINNQEENSLKTRDTKLVLF